MDEKKRRASSAWQEFERTGVGFVEKGREEGEEKEFPLKKWMRPKKRSFIERSLEKPFLFSKKKKRKINVIFLMRRIFNKNLKKR